MSFFTHWLPVYIILAAMTYIAQWCYDRPFEPREAFRLSWWWPVILLIVCIDLSIKLYDFIKLKTRNLMHIIGQEKKIYTRKVIRIETIEGDVIEFDINGSTGVPIGYDEPPNSPVYAAICATIGQVGYSNTKKTDETIYTHIPPSQIKSVSFNYREK